MIFHEEKGWEEGDWEVWVGLRGDGMGDSR
jgi:hypothetical protein